MKKREVYKIDEIELNDDAKPYLRNFAQTLNRTLSEKGVSQEELAAATGLSVGSISGYRHGQKDPRLSAIKSISEYLDVDAHYLITGVKAGNRSAVKRYGLSETALSRLETARSDFQDMNFTLPALSRLLASESFWKLLRNLAIFEHECNVVESRRAMQPETTDEEKRARADYTFARYDRAVLRSALHDDLNNVMNETEGTAKKTWQTCKNVATRTET